jgi:hypothetical protein
VQSKVFITDFDSITTRALILIVCAKNFTFPSLFFLFSKYLMRFLYFPLRGKVAEKTKGGPENGLVCIQLELMQGKRVRIKTSK